MSSITRRLRPIINSYNITRKIRSMNHSDLLSMVQSILPEHFLLISDEYGLKQNIKKIFHLVINPEYSNNLKKILTILLKNLDIKKENFDILIKNIKKKGETTMSPKYTYLYFQTILYQRQLIDAILHELVMIRIANKIFQEMKDNFSKSSKAIKGGGLTQLFLLIIGVVVLTLTKPSSDVVIPTSSSDLKTFSSELINKAQVDLQKIKSAHLSENKENLKKIFAVSSSISISTSKGGKQLNPIQTQILTEQLKSALYITNEKYSYYKDDIIEECRRSFSSVGQISPEVSALGSIQDLLLHDAIKVDIKSLKESSVYKTTEDISQEVASVIPGMVGSISKGVWSGMFGTTEQEAPDSQVETKKESEKQLLNDYIIEKSGELIEGQDQAFSIIAGQLFMDIQCNYLPTAKYTVEQNGDNIVVQFSYATQNTGIIIDSLALLMSKINYLKQSVDTSDEERALLNLHSEKVFQLLKLANYGPFLAILSDHSEGFDAGKLIAEVESKYRSYEVEVLKLFEDFSQTKQQSEELLRAISSLGEITRHKKRELNEQFWKNFETDYWENIERVASNVKEGTANAAKGTADVFIDTASHIIDKSMLPFLKLSLMGATGIGLMILFYCAIPYIRSRISTQKDSKKEAPPPIEPQQPSNEGEQPSNEGEPRLMIPLGEYRRRIRQQPPEEPEHEGGRTQKKRRKRVYKNKKSRRRNRLFIKRQ